MADNLKNENPNIGLKINPVASKTTEIGVDLNNTLAASILDAVQIGALDISSINALNNNAQGREFIYQLIDIMAQDSSISAVLETYAEDTVQANDKGKIVWVESDDSKVLEYTQWLVDTLDIDKHIYKWAYCVITYGDVYLRLYRKSDVADDVIFKNNSYNKKLNEAEEKTLTNEKDTKLLSEAIQLKLYESSDKYIPYVKMIDNPAEMFDLQRFGKTYGYIKAPVTVMQHINDEYYTYLTRYKIKQSDIEIFDATSFVHGCLEATNQRQPETVDIYLDTYKKQKSDILDGNVEVDYDENDSDLQTSYDVKKGQSLLYNTFRVWRELNLLEMSALLNRLTKSALVRILNVDVGDMPKEQVQAFMSRLKEKIEQKSAINVGHGMAEYTNPGPIENTIYVPTHGGQGSITQTTIGGDFDPKSLVDLEYFRDQLYGALKVPKAFFGVTDDGAGFNGGTSLSIISSRYGKAIKNIQNVLCQMITDLINLFLLDRGLGNYINKFTVRMQPPITQEEIDRRSNTDNRIRYIGDVMGQLSDIEDPVTKLKIYKALLTNAVNDPEIVKYIQEYIEKLEKEGEGKEEENSEPESNLNAFDSEAFNTEPEAEEETLEDQNQNEAVDTSDMKEVINEKSKDEDDDSYLPSPEELGLDLVKD